MQMSEHFTYLCNHLNHTNHFVPGGYLKLARKENVNTDRFRKWGRGSPGTEWAPESGWVGPLAWGHFRTSLAHRSPVTMLLMPDGCSLSQLADGHTVPWQEALGFSFHHGIHR